MYRNAAVLAALVFIYGAIAGRVERSRISGPMVFTGMGLILGPTCLGVLQLNVASEGLRILAELTLAMVLFADAAGADLGIVRRNIRIPARLLLIGLPLTIILGCLLARLMFPSLDALEMALLAAMLAPTDAALGKPVVTNRGVPGPIRELLNVESGLNDGICVPIVVILLELAVGTQIEGSTMTHMVRVVAEEIGIGLIVGLVLSWGATHVLRASSNEGWMSRHWLDAQIVALATACFAAAQSVGGSGFIACFAGGLMFGALREGRGPDHLRGAQATGETLALLTWVVFGAAVVGQMIGRLAWPVLVYSVLSLTVIRMLPVYLSLTGTGMRPVARLFVGWFGPRGIASIVFGIMVVGERLPGNDTLVAAIACTVVLSIVAHGTTANPLTRVIAASQRASTSSD